MGIFQSRPEEPTEWAGLPAEPWEPRAASEVLPPPVGDLGLFGAAGAGLSVPIEAYLPDSNNDDIADEASEPMLGE